MRRAVLLVAWLVGSILAWWCIVVVLGSTLVKDVALINGLSLGGTYIVPAIVLVLALTGKLPGDVNMAKINPFARGCLGVVIALGCGMLGAVVGSQFPNYGPEASKVFGLGPLIFGALGLIAGLLVGVFIAILITVFLHGDESQQEQRKRE